MEQIEVEKIKQKTAKNFLYLSLRNFGIQIITTLGFFILTVILGAGEVGLFAIVAESIAILGYFSDVGLASALIQQKDETNTRDLRTSFTVQQILVFIGITIIAVIYPSIAKNNHYGDKEFWILLSLCFSFVASSLKTIPSVLLERKLDFQKLSLVDIVENVLFYIVAVAFALMGYGVFSYAIATFIKSIVGLIVIYRLEPWDIGFGFSLTTAKKLMRYGIPFQANSLIAVAKDRLSNLLVAGIIGRESFGLLSWAQKGPRIPLSFMDAIMKITFPTFSRIQDHRELLKKSITKSIHFIALIVFPLLGGIALVSSDVVNIIPKYTKWQPAIVPLYFYAISYALAAVTTPITNAFNAVGKIKTTTKLMIMWTILTWIFYPILSLKFGYYGTSVAALIVGSSSVVVWILSKKYFDTNIFKIIIHPSLATILFIIVGTLISSFTPVFLIKIIIKIICGVLIYGIYSWISSKEDIKWFIAQAKWLKN